MTPEAQRMVRALALAGAEWEAMHAPRDAEQVDADRLLQRAQEIVERALADERDE